MKLRLVAWFFIAFFLFSPKVGLAQENFDYNYILSDDDMFDYVSMDLVQINSFLKDKGSALANYVDPITSLAASQIIYLSAQEFKISPKFLLALLQKEQSLIENPRPSNKNFDWAMGYAVCDSCSLDDPLLQKFKGFYNQIYSAAKRIRLSYLVDLDSQNRTISGFGPGLPKLVDGQVVIPANKATAIAYTYTPHLAGNRLLWTVWNRYFSRYYPDGTLLNVDGQTEVYYIQNGLRRQFANRSVFLSYYDDFSSVLTVNKTELSKYLEGSPIKFSNYSFLRIPKGTVYLLADDMLRGIASAEVLRRLGINPEEIVNVSSEDIISYGEGEPITDKSIYPLGVLLQDTKSGGIFWVQEGVKHPIWSREILQNNFKNRKISRATTKQLEQYLTGLPIVFRDGQLVRSWSQATVYLISNQTRRPFLSAEAFLDLGFDFSKVIATSDEAISIHVLGDPIGVSF
ncbi:hypothetical protein KKC17_03580 [Patescibacteria group bacterium]|nr:hypothetical protein [Patescibacteria group bacterium]